MFADDPAGPYVALKESGGSPQAIYSAAKADGLERIVVIRVLRSLFGLSLQDAKKVISSVDGPLPGELPGIQSHEQLTKILEAEMGYCSCASGDTLTVLQQFLQAAQNRADATNDRESFARASRELEDCLRLDVARGFANWFVYGLEQRGFIWHGFRLTDAWITEKGRWLLEAIKRLPPPVGEE